ncbi:MAG: YhdH/YhfP family quinone oxidoreductase [Calditrichaeota bacterium]|nr:YhdH/YhfP family quinone oxidoreductase [Calditrichota bacterium]
MQIKQPFRAYLATKDDSGDTHAEIVPRNLSDLPQGDVTIQVAYSSLNYKDALSATGVYGVTRNYPHVPGIDAAGIVARSENSDFQPGDRVLVTGYDLGADTDGGYEEYIRVPADWVVPLPLDLSLKQGMILGTAGFTAAIGINAALENNLKPSAGEVVVTGATGGVGSIAVALLAKEKFQVVAVTGKADAVDFLKFLGASRVIGREELNDQSNKPLLKMVWAGGMDTVGGNTLSTLVRSTRNHGVISACGVVAGAELNLTVYPFILRGVRLIGVDSAQWPKEPRWKIWRRLAHEWKIEQLEDIATTIQLEQLPEYIEKILQGKIRGRVVVEINGELE